MVKNVSDIANCLKGGQTGRTDLKEYGTNRISIGGCMALIVDSGYAIAFIGLKRRVMKRGMLFLLFYDDTFWVERSSRTFSCRYVTLAYDNVEEAVFKLTSPCFWDSLSDSGGLSLDEPQKQRFENWYQQMEWVCREIQGEYGDIMLRNNIYNLFMAVDFEMERKGLHDKENICSGRSLILEFLKILPQYAKQTRSVAFYADKLCISTAYLNKLTHRWLNASPKELIGLQTICEIKTLLTTTDLSVKEIAFLLHFEDTPYMCRYFRRFTKVSPMEYRNGIKR